MLDALIGAPVIVKVLCSLAIIIVINGLCKRLLVSVTIGVLALGLWCGHPLWSLERISIADIAWKRFSGLNNILLLVIVFQVIWLSTQMSATEITKDLVVAVRSRISRRASMAALPALIGWLPMPGGALFSAPLLDRCDPNGHVQPLLKTHTNYWFRHVWEYWWPLYPGVLLAMEITGLDVWQFVLLQLPLSLFSAVAGYLFFLRRIPPEPDEEQAIHANGPRTPFLPLIAPIIIVVGCYTVIKAGHAVLSHYYTETADLNKYLPMIVGITLAMCFVQKKRPLSWASWRAILFNRKVTTLILVVAAVRIYGALIDGNMPDGTRLVDLMNAEMAGWHVPAVGVIMLIPFVCGLTSGLAVGFVGASFPIVISVLGNNPPMGVLLSATILAYTFGYMGMILSPVHICLIVTNEHFKTRLTRSLAGLLRPAAVVLAGAGILYLLIRFLWHVHA